MVSSKNKCKIEYFIPGPEKDADGSSGALAQSIHSEFKDIFKGIGYFNPFARTATDSDQPLNPHSI